MRREGTVDVACPLVLSAVPMPLVKAEDVPGRTCGVLSSTAGNGDGDEAEVVSGVRVVGDVPFVDGGNMIYFNEMDGDDGWDAKSLFGFIIRGRGFQLAPSLGTRCD